MPNRTIDRKAIDEIVATHNKARKEVGVSPLKWSETLAQHAQDWANELAARQSMDHSDPGSTKEGENLSQGTPDESYTQMVQRWVDEQKNFIPGKNFPDCSSTGNWEDVGHYTQIVWKNTTEVGCGIASYNGEYILVCRYTPQGNWDNQPVY